MAGKRIAVVGAGIIGCAVGFELARRGAAVTVLDGRRIGGGATQASAGILAPYTEAHVEGPLFDLTVRGLDAYDAFVESVRAVSRLPFEYRRAGTLEIAEDDARAGELRARLGARWAASAGLRWLEADALQRAVPSISRTCVGALLCAAHGHVAVPPFIAAIADAARSLGAQIRPKTSIGRIECTSAAVIVHTSSETQSFDRVVLCAGSWTPAVDPLGQTTGRITPVRGQLVKLLSSTRDVACVLWGRSCYIVPWQDGTLLVGATTEDVGFDERATAGGVRELLVAAEELLPDLRFATFGDVLVGLRPATADGLPVLGPSRDRRVAYAAGHFRNGILLAPLTARLLADYVLEGTLDPAFSTGPDPDLPG